MRVSSLGLFKGSEDETHHHPALHVVSLKRILFIPPLIYHKRKKQLQYS